MSETKLCNEGDFALSEKLHREYERAMRAREAAQSHIDAAAAAYENACLRRHAAANICEDVPPARIEALEAAQAAARRERDQVTAEADEPLRRARQAMLEHDRHFVDAATNWLGIVIRDYGPTDPRLEGKCQPARIELEAMFDRRASLREIADYFQPIFDELSVWELPRIDHITYGVTRPALMFHPPRLSALLAPR